MRRSKIGLAASIPTKQAVLTQKPKTAAFTDRRACLPAWIDIVVWIGGVLFEVNLQLIEFGRRKARNTDVQSVFNEQLGKLRQLDSKPLAIPSGIVADLVIRKR